MKICLQFIILANASVNSNPARMVSKRRMNNLNQPQKNPSSTNLLVQSSKVCISVI